MARLYNYNTNAYEEVPEDLIRDKVLTGKYVFHQNEKVPIIATNGSRYLIPGARAHEAFSDGSRYGNTKDWERIANKEEYAEGWENYVGAGLAGAGRGATLGLSDVILEPLLGKERMQTWRKELPEVSIGTEIGGAVLPALLSGGGSTAVSGTQLTVKGAALARNARTAFGVSDVLLPAKGLFKGGRYLEETLAGSKLLGRTADKGLALKILQTSVPKGVAGALEGAAFGAGTTLTESLLGDPEDVMELLISNVGLSALLGGFGNAGINATLMGGAAGTRKLSNGFASLYEKATNSKLSVAGQKKYFSYLAKFLGKDSAETLMNQQGLTAAGQALRAEVTGYQATFGSQVDGIASSMNSLADDVGAVMEASRRVGKAEAVRGSILEGIESTSRKGSEDALQEVAAFLEANSMHLDEFARAAKGEFKWRGAVGALKEGDPALVLQRLFGLTRKGTRNEAVDAWLGLASGLDDVALKELAKDSFLMLDDFKKYSQGLAFGGKIEARAAGLTREMNAKLGGLLEDAGLWGEAAVKQSKINPLFNELLEARIAFRGASGFKGRLTADNIEKFLEQVVDNPKLADALGDYVAAAKSFGSTAGKEYNFAGWQKIGDKTVSGLFEKGSAAAGRLGSDSYSKTALLRAKKLAEEVRMHKELFGITGLDAFTSEVAGGLMGALRSKAGRTVAKGIVGKALGLRIPGGGFGAGGLLGGMFGGPAGAMAGALLGGLVDGAGTARQLAAIEQAVKKARSGLNKSMDKTVKHLTSGGPGGSIPSRPNRTKLFLAPLSAQFAGGAQEESKTKQDYYSRAKTRGQHFADPQVLMGAVNKVTEPIDHDMPNLATAMKMKLTTAIQEANGGFNKDSRTIDDKLMGVPERQPTDREIAQQEIRLAIVEDPINEFLGSVADGTVTATHTETIKKVYPMLFNHLVAGLLDRITSSEGNVSYRGRKVLSIALGRPFDVSYKSENVNVLQSSYGEKSQEGGKIKSSPLIKHPGLGPTEVERVMMG